MTSGNVTSRLKRFNLFRVGSIRRVPGRFRETNRMFHRLRVIVLIALPAGMRMAEIFDLTWHALRYSEGPIAVCSLRMKTAELRRSGNRRLGHVISE